MPTTHLQGLGTVDALPACELTPGMVTVWNYGGTYRVLSVETLSPKYVRLNMTACHPSTGEDTSEGKVWSRRTGRTFLVGIARNKGEKKNGIDHV